MGGGCWWEGGAGWRGVLVGGAGVFELADEGVSRRGVPEGGRCQQAGGEGCYSWRAGFVCNQLYLTCYTEA